MKKLAIAVVTTLALSACGQNYSNGTRTGVVQKFSEKGLIWKSWEGELLMGGVVISEGGSIAPQIFRFNADPAVASKVQEAQQSGKRVTLEYRQWFMAPLTIDSSTVVIEVK